MDYWLVRLVSNSKYLFLLLIVLTLIFRLVFLRFLRVGNHGRMLMDYFGLGFAALGLITLSANVRVWVAQNYLGFAETRATVMFEELQRAITNDSAYICRVFNQTPQSPTNLDDIQKEHDEACNWYKNIANSLPKRVDPNFPPLHFENIEPLKVTDPILISFKRRLTDIFANYEECRKRVEDIRSKTHRSTSEEFIFAMSPIFLCIALAIGFTKVSAGKTQ